MTTNSQKGERTKDGTGAEGVPRWYGVYLGRVTHTRQGDLWVRFNVPQLLGDKEISNWARPAGFNSVGAIDPPVADITNDGNGADERLGPLGWGGFQKDNGRTRTTNDQGGIPEDHPDGRGRPVGFGDERGPGPPVGSLVLVLFLGGDINEPAYLLTSQRASS